MEATDKQREYMVGEQQPTIETVELMARKGRHRMKV